MPTLFNRLLISMGLAVLTVIIGSSVSVLLLMAAEQFGWPVLIGGGFVVFVLLFVIDTITSAFTPTQ